MGTVSQGMGLHLGVRHHNHRQQIKMGWHYATLALGLAASASAETYEEEGDARLGYISVGSSGATSITFNATSIQNAVILGLFTLVLPLFGVSLGSLFGSDSTDSGYSYGFDQPEFSNGYEASGNAYNSFSKRSVEMLGPVLDALKTHEEKY